jgi:GDP-4-dehydro-6-deoxy-D-mannose reductase
MTLPKRILITGANGFTGNHACLYFQENGYEVISIVRKETELRVKNIEVCELTDNKYVFNLLNKYKPEYVLHLAGQNHVQKSWIDPINSIEANMMSTLYILEAIRKIGEQCKIVVVGSALQFEPGLTPFPPHPYSLSKTLQGLIAKSWAKLFNMDIVIAKPSNLIGPGHSEGVCSIFGKKIASMEKDESEKTLEVYDIEVERDFLDVRDAVKAYELLLKYGKSCEEYKIASGQSRSLKEVVTTFKHLSTVDFHIKTIHNEIPIAPFTMETSKISSLGFKPSIPFESSLNDILNYFRNNG